jgi:hypothetical protein
MGRNRAWYRSRRTTALVFTYPLWGRRGLCYGVVSMRDFWRTPWPWAFLIGALTLTLIRPLLVRPGELPGREGETWIGYAYSAQCATDCRRTAEAAEEVAELLARTGSDLELAPVLPEDHASAHGKPFFLVDPSGKIVKRYPVDPEDGLAALVDHARRVDGAHP